MFKHRSSNLYSIGIGTFEERLSVVLTKIEPLSIINPKIDGSFPRFVDQQLLQRNADWSILLGRQATRDNMTPGNPDSFIVREQPGKYQKIHKYTILEKWLGEMDDTKEECKNYLKKQIALSKPGKLPDLQLIDLLPEGTPLVLSFKAEIESNPYSWQFPSRSLLHRISQEIGMTPEVLKNTLIKEVTICRSADDSVQEFVDWISDRTKEDNHGYPSEVITCSVAFITVRDRDIAKLKLRVDEKNPSPVRAKDASELEDNSKIPTKIILGGKSWVAIIRTNITEVVSSDDSIGYLLFPTGEIQPELIKLLESLPTLIGFHLHTTIKYLQSFLDMVYNAKVKLPGGVCLTALAKAAGYQPKVCDLFHLHLLTLGEIINAPSMSIDGHWAQQWDGLAKEFKILTARVSNSIYSLYVVLMGLLVRNVFPDPDILCSLLEMSQEDTYLYICGMFNFILRDKKVGPYEEISSREALILSLDPCCDEDPKDPNIWHLSSLILNIPSVPLGGAQYLHTVRTRALYQYEIMQKIAFVHATLAPNLHRDVRGSFAEVSLYGRPITMDSGEVCESGGLKSNPEFAENLLELDVEKISDQEFLDLRAPDGISLANAVSEWARLNVDLIGLVMRKLKDLSESGMARGPWFSRTVLYENLRLIYRRTTTQNTIRVPYLEELIQKTRDRAVGISDNLAQKAMIKSVQGSSAQVQNPPQSQRNQQNTQLRSDLFRNIQSDDRESPRVAQHQVVFSKVPGDNHARNLLWKEKRKAKKRAIMQQKQNTYLPDKEFQDRKKLSYAPVLDLRTKLDNQKDCIPGATRAAKQPGGGPRSVAQGYVKAVTQPGITRDNTGGATVNAVQKKKSEYHCQPLPFIPRKFRPKRTSGAQGGSRTGPQSGSTRDRRRSSSPTPTRGIKRGDRSNDEQDSEDSAPNKRGWRNY